MATIRYQVSGSFPPFAVELRSGSTVGNVIDSMVAQSANTVYEFTGVPDSGEFFVVAYDTAGGNSVDSTGLTTTTTTTTTSTTTTTAAPTTTTTTTPAPTTTTTTTPAPTTTTTTTLPPTTTTTTTAAPLPLFMSVWAYPPDLSPADTNYDSGDLTNGTTIQVMYSTNPTDYQGTGTALANDVDIDITFDINNLDGQFLMGDHADASGIITSTLPSQGTDISSSSFSFTLDSSITTGRGWFTIDVLNQTINPDTYTITLNIGGTQGYVFGLVSDSSDPDYVPAGTAGTDYGYSALASNFIINIDGEISP
jgi:hypothetical protein